MKTVDFTPAQQNAMDVSRRHLDTCVVAGPGSGKTTVLVEYFRRLVEAGTDPLRILAITFTEKAAANMRDKLAGIFREDPTLRARMERAWVSTVHGFCTRLLQENAVFAGVEPGFRIADANESWRFEQEAMAEAIDEEFAARPAAVRRLIRGLCSAKFEEAVLASYDAMRGAGMRVDNLEAMPPPAGVRPEAIAGMLRDLRRESVGQWTGPQKQQYHAALEGAARIVEAPTPLEALAAIEQFACSLTKCRKGNSAYSLLKRMKEAIEESKYWFLTAHYAPERQLLLDVLARFDRIYRQRKRQAGKLDFADLEEFAVRLLEEHAETRERVRRQFDQILMDEYQDTNGQQARLLALVRRPGCFYAVGDINQSIFGFRHAEPDGFRQYRLEVKAGGHEAELMENFRSRAHILSAVESVMSGASGIEDRSLVARRKFEAERPVAVEVLRALGGESLEAQWVARRILELAGEAGESRFQDVAVLLRNTEVLGEFCRAFEAAGIPYLAIRGKGFYENREVNDLAHLLRVIANPRDEVSLAAMLRSPLVGASDEALLWLKSLGENLGNNLGAALMDLDGARAAQFAPADAARLTRFRDHLRQWRARRAYVSFDRLLAAAIDDCGYRPESGARGTANLDKFLAQAREASTRMTLDGFVEELELVRESDRPEADAPPEDAVNAVKIMTVHAAKGLEFPVVFVAALHKGIDTGTPVVAFSPRYGLGARWRNPARATDARPEDKNDVYGHAIHQERKRREEEESSRLFYVAMTRAEQHLALSFSGLAGKKQQNWAADLTRALHLDTEAPRDEVLAFAAPDGKAWKLRVQAAADPPAPLPPRALRVEPVDRPVEWLAPPAVESQQDGNASVTAVARFATCPRKYYLQDYLGFLGRQPELPVAGARGSLPANELGTQVHDLLASLPVPDAAPEALRLAKVFSQSSLGRRLERASRVEREFDFLLAVEDLVVTGKVDLWFEEGGELVIVDYKTDQVTAAEAHQRARDYALQLRLYALAVERVAGRPPHRAWLHFLRPNTLVEVELAPSLLDSPEQVVRELAEAQNALEFPLREAEHCRRCEFFRDLCPAGGLP